MTPTKSGKHVYQDRVFEGSAASEQIATCDTLVDLCIAQAQHDGQQRC